MPPNGSASRPSRTGTVSSPQRETEAIAGPTISSASLPGSARRIWI